MLLRFDAALTGRLAGFGWSPQPRLDRRLPNQIDQSFEGILTIASLGAVTLRGNHQHPVAGQAGAGEAFESLAYSRR